MPDAFGRPSRRIVLLSGAAAAIGGGALLWERASPLPAEDPVQRAAQIRARYGVYVAWGDPASFRTAPDGLTGIPIAGARVHPASLTDVPPALEGIAESLGRYPAGFFARLCPTIFICGALRFGHARAGGTFGPRWILLAADPSVGAGGIRETARLGVHHEFSSLVWDRSPGVRARWATLMPVGWRPTDGTAAALGRAGERTPDAGFLSAYAATSLENDFNTYAETALTDPGTLLACASATPVVAAKTRLLVAAYQALDERWTAAFAESGLETYLSKRPMARM